MRPYLIYGMRILRYMRWSCCGYNLIAWKFYMIDSLRELICAYQFMCNFSAWSWRTALWEGWGGFRADKIRRLHTMTTLCEVSPRAFTSGMKSCIFSRHYHRSLITNHHQQRWYPLVFRIHCHLLASLLQNPSPSNPTCQCSQSYILSPPSCSMNHDRRQKDHPGIPAGNCRHNKRPVPGALSALEDSQVKSWVVKECRPALQGLMKPWDKPLRI